MSAVLRRTAVVGTRRAAPGVERSCSIAGATWCATTRWVWPPNSRPRWVVMPSTTKCEERGVLEDLCQAVVHVPDAVDLTMAFIGWAGRKVVVPIDISRGKSLLCVAVLSCGIVGDRGGRATVQSPILKQAFAPDSGSMACFSPRKPVSATKHPRGASRTLAPQRCPG